MTPVDTVAIRAALASATPGPWEWTDELRQRLLGRGRTDEIIRCAALLHPMRADAYLIANAPTWLEALCDEVERLKDSILTFGIAIGFGDGKNEPAATLDEMVDTIKDAFHAEWEHGECPHICEYCGEWLATEICEACYGSGDASSMAGQAECPQCGGDGWVHDGCAHISYADLVAERDALRARLEQIEALNRTLVAKTVDAQAEVERLRARLEAADAIAREAGRG